MQSIRRYWRAFAALGLIAIGVALVLSGVITVERAVALLDAVRELGPVPYALLFLLGTMLCMPASILMESAGFVFGAWIGLPVAWGLFVLGGTLNFLVARFLLRGPVGEFMRRKPLLRAIERVAAERGTSLAALLRMSPVFPANPISYLLGSTPMSLGSFVFGTAIGVFPVIAMHVVIGSALSSLTELASGGPSVHPAVTVVALVATLVVTLIITRMARKALAESLNQDDDELIREVTSEVEAIA